MIQYKSNRFNWVEQVDTKTQVIVGPCFNIKYCKSFDCVDFHFSEEMAALHASLEQLKGQAKLNVQGRHEW